MNHRNRVLTNIHVRNLYWLLFSPVLEVNTTYAKSELLFPQGLQEKWLDLHRDWFSKEDDAPGKINKRITNCHAGYKIGVYAEQLLLYFFSESPFIKLLEANRQLVRDSVTVSEIDFLVEFEGKLLHLEVAVKYYLLTDTKEWVGPNKRDTFQRKWEKVVQKQVPEAQRFFVEQGYGNVESFFFVKGYLFTQNSERNNWVTLSKNCLYEDKAAKGFVLPKKPNWMADFEHFRGKTMNSFELNRELKEHTTDLETAVPVITLLGSGQKVTFIVPEDWSDKIIQP